MGNKHRIRFSLLHNNAAKKAINLKRTIDFVSFAKNAKIKLEFVEETSKTVESGIIIKQEIGEDTEINAGDTVKAYISIGTGIKQVVVSSVYNKDEATAKKRRADL